MNRTTALTTIASIYIMILMVISLNMILELKEDCCSKSSFNTEYELELKPNSYLIKDRYNNVTEVPLDSLQEFLIKDNL